MRLNCYSVGAVDPLWFPGGLPYADMDSRTIAVAFTCAGPSQRLLTGTGTLICYRAEKSNEVAVTLECWQLMGHALPASDPGAVERKALGVTPLADIRTYVRIPLPREAVAGIRKVSGHDHEFELSLEGVELVDVQSSQR